MTYRIVVAEDEALIRLDLVDMLRGAGYDVVGDVANGAQALDMVREKNPDLAILDVKMPVMDGITAAEKLDGSCAILILTAFSQKELIDRASEAGAMAYVVKPFTLSELQPSIEIAVARFRQMKALEAEVKDIHERLESRKLIDRAKGILMGALNLSEPEAFSWIQKTAMDRRISMKAVAEAVISPEKSLF